MTHQLYVQHIQGMDNITETPCNRNKTVCVGCTARMLVMNTFHYSSVCLHYVVPLSTHFRLYLVKVHMKENRRLVRFFKKRIHCWCVFSYSICNQDSHCIRGTQNTSFQGSDGIHRSWEDINYGERWPKTKGK